MVNDLVKLFETRAGFSQMIMNQLPGENLMAMLDRKYSLSGSDIYALFGHLYKRNPSNFKVHTKPDHIGYTTKLYFMGHEVSYQTVARVRYTPKSAHAFINSWPFLGAA